MDLFQLSKKFISTQNFYNFYIKKRVEELDKIFQNGKNNLNRVRRVIKIKNLLGADLSKEAKFYLSHQLPENEQIISLNSNGKLSDFSKQIIDIVDGHQKLLLNAPTGTGKSYLVKNIFPVRYKNILTISPLRMVTDEITQNSIFQDVKKIQNLNIHTYLAVEPPDYFSKILFTERLLPRLALRGKELGKQGLEFLFLDGSNHSLPGRFPREIFPGN